MRKVAHVLERIGLAMAGAACGLFVAAHVGSSIAALTSQGFIAIMMISGAIGFYLGIDTPPLAFHESSDGSGGEIDAAEFLTAVGTFLATWTAFVSVTVIVFPIPHVTAKTTFVVAPLVTRTVRGLSPTEQFGPTDPSQRV